MIGAIRTRLGLVIPTKTQQTLMPNTQQWNVPGATDIADTDKLSGSQGPVLGQDKTFTWALIKSKLTSLFAPSFTTLQNQINALAPAVTYTAPAVVETLTGDQPGWFESGASLAGSMAASLTVNDSGGPAAGTPIKFLQGGQTVVGLSSPHTYEYQGSDGQSITLQATIDYLAGAVKNNPVTGLPSPSGAIQAGTAQGAIKTWMWSYAIFYGPVGVAAIAITTIRSTSGISQSLARQLGATGQFTLNTGTVDRIMVIVMPPGFIIDTVIDLDSLSANVTEAYEQTTLGNPPTDATGTPYATNNVYQFTQQVPYSTNHRHLVTMKAGNLTA
jgi:hypothetical protein